MTRSSVHPKLAVIKSARREYGTMSHPTIRVNQAREAATEVARLVKGGDLSAEETSMVNEAVERVIDLLEADARRIFICPHGDAVVQSADGKNSIPCPTHGAVAQQLPMGLGIRGPLVAVVYQPVKD